jgi:hypothetical protein
MNFFSLIAVGFSQRIIDLISRALATLADRWFGIVMTKFELSIQNYHRTKMVILFRFEIFFLRSPELSGRREPCKRDFKLVDLHAGDAKYCVSTIL